MASYGFEVEFATIQFFLPFQDAERENIFLIQDAKTNETLFYVTPDGFADQTDRNEPNPYRYNMEIISPPYRDKTFFTHQLQPIWLFLKFLKHNFSTNKIEINSVIIEQLTQKQGYPYKFVYVFPTSIFIRIFNGEKDPPIDTIDNVHMTFGMNIPVLSNFYRYYNPAKAFPELNQEFTNDLEPYSKDSQSAFFNFCKKNDNININNEIFYVIEFLKFYLGCMKYLMPTREKEINSKGYGYKALLLLMSRTAFKNMIQISAFYKKANVNKNKDVCTEIIEYLKFCLPKFKESTNLLSKESVYHTGTIGNPKIQYMQSEILQEYTFNALTLNNIVQSIFRNITSVNFTENAHQELRYDEYPKNILPLSNELVDIMMSNINSDIQKQGILNSQCILSEKEIIKNAFKWDWLSPVPVSPPDDPMGFYSRVKNQYEPLIEVRDVNSLFMQYAKKNKIPQEQYILFNDNWQNFLTMQFEAALNDWSTPNPLWD